MPKYNFRAWINADKRMVKVSSINFDSDSITAKHALYDYLERYEIGNAILMQSTGLYDSTKFDELTPEEQRDFIKDHYSKELWRGREIYEGDIVEDDSKTMVKLPELDRAKSHPEEYARRIGIVKFGLHDIPANDPFDSARAWGFYIFGKTFSNTLADYCFPNHRYSLKVVGNIYANEELAKGVE